MATINPIQAGPLKITFPANLPKNEKDLICMLLAGRLKDLLNGRLICAQLAIDDLIKDLTGVSPLAELRQGLMDLKSTLNDLKSATGYDNILAAINQGLSQIGNVFSLGGLCPSPVHPPKIPDVLGQLNNNLMGQLGGILNALAKASNPSMCLGGGPGGFGVNWNSIDGDLKNLKNAIARFKADPAGFNSTMNAFKNNINGQTNRLKSEIKRLEKNLSDPFGIKDRQRTVKSLMSAKNVSDGYKVKDKRGIEQPVLKAMVPADIEHVLNRTDPLSTAPIIYKTKTILDYCGDVVGYEKYTVSGDPNYLGWDTNPDANNGDTPTVNPTATYKDFDYLFTLNGSSVVVYNTAGSLVTSIMLTRGQLYRIGLELNSAHAIKFYSNFACTTPWIEGLTYSKDPEYGHGIEVITPEAATTYTHGEIDWAVLLEDPTTPNTLYWKSADGKTGTLTVDGATAIPYADRIYDLSMAVKKALLHIAKTSMTIPGTSSTIQSEANIRTRIYDVISNVYNGSGTKLSTTNSTVKFSDNTATITDDTETLDEQGYPISGNKIIKYISKYTSNQYLITKRFVNDRAGLAFNKIYFYISSDTTEANATDCVFIELVNPLSILNSSKLPFTDHYSYKLSLLHKEGNSFIPVFPTINNSDATTFELVVPSDDVYLIRWNLTSNTEATKSSVSVNDFVVQTDIKIDPEDKQRTFINSDPKEYRTYFYFKFKDFAFDYTELLNSTLDVDTGPSPAPSPSPSPSPSPAPEDAPQHNGVRLIASGENPTYWIYPVPTNQVYPTSATMTVSPTFIDVGETTEITLTWTFNNGLVALEPMQISIEDRSTHFGTYTATINIEPGQSSYSWTRSVQKFQWPASWVILTYPTIPRYYDPRLPLPHSVGGYEPPTIRVSSKSKPILYDQTIACSLVAGQGNERQGFYGILETYTEGTALYDVHYYEDGEQYFVYRGGCRPPTTN